MLSCCNSKPQGGLFGFREVLDRVADIRNTVGRTPLLQRVEEVASEGVSSLADGRAGGFLANIRNTIRNNPLLRQRILENRLNPCDGEAPKFCNCTDGQEFPFSIDYNSNPCNGSESVPDLCTCPSGQTFKPKNVAEKAATEFGIPTCGEGQAPVSCTCRDGEISSIDRAEIVGGAGPCGGRIPQSCTCQDGRVITATQVISKIIPALQEILG